MLTAINKYPFFELSEIIPELSFDYRPYKSLQPVKAGNFIPDFTLHAIYERWQQFYNGAETHGPVLLRQLLNKPLVISFYSHYWREAGLEQLKQWNALQYEIKASGGNLLIINSGKDDDFQRKAWEHSLSLNFYKDTDNDIAKKFRIYSDEDPIWNKFSGIDVNAPLLATYVIDPSKQILYSYIDRNADGHIPVKEVLTAVYEAALNSNRKISA